MQTAMVNVLKGMGYAYAACFSFAILFNLRGRRLFLTAVGSAIGWGLYLTFENQVNPLLLTFLCMTVVATYAEVMAVVDKCPMTVYLVVGFLPFVPGAGLYFTMKHAVEGEIGLFLSQGLNTLGTALSMGVAVAVVLYGFNAIQSLRRMFARLQAKVRRSGKSASKM